MDIHEHGAHPVHGLWPLVRSTRMRPACLVGPAEGHGLFQLSIKCPLHLRVMNDQRSKKHERMGSALSGKDIGLRRLTLIGCGV